ncbi:D-amino-acid dehydrogenase [Burkholderiales bacterium]|nr:D-amino-acid dehydrogenase [Burkholderiales bacterium]
MTSAVPAARGTDGTGPTAIVVGAGIIGATAAYELQKAGVATTLIDADAPGMGCSYGNAGAISPGSVAPLAMPGVLRSVFDMLRDPEGPLHVRPMYLPRALPWLLRFAAAARPARVERIAAELHDLHRGAIEAHEALAREIGAPELVQRRGHLHLYPDERALAKDAGSWALRRRFGVTVARLDRARILELEPAVGPRYAIGMHLPDHAMVVSPHRYVECIVAAYRRRGGRLATNRVTRVDARGGGWTCTGVNDAWHADHLVVAAGVGSGALLAPLGIRPPIESQRGYHVTFIGVPRPTTRVVVLADRKAFTTPMEEGFRIAGTVEIAGLEPPPNPRRIAVLERIARETFRALDGATARSWMGHRPCMPDTLPWIGPAPKHPGLWFAFGHGHTGVTDAPGTARRLRDAITGSR